MGRLEERISKLEAHAEAAQLTEEARQKREQDEVLSRLSVEDLSALLEIVDAFIERSEDSSTLVDFHEFADERYLRAMARYEDVLEAVCREVSL
jgi:hypothetical protein